MWQTDWARTPADGGLSAPSDAQVNLLLADVERTSLLFWMEHCVECAVPDCYSVCPLYIARADAKCARFAYGIFPNTNFNGLFDYGAEMHFRRWGKLESKLGFGTATPTEVRKTAARDRSIVGLVNRAAEALTLVNPKRRLNGAYNQLREKSLRAPGKSRQTEAAPFDAFVIEVFNPPGQNITLILECTDAGRPTFRKSFPLETGRNFFTIPFEAMQINLASVDGRIRIYPDQDAEPRLVFTWLDFVKYAHSAVKPVAKETPKLASEVAPQPAKKVKCVAFDLDNTLWKGILVEDGPEALIANQAAIDLIYKLDDRGIICTALSKNDHAAAMAVIERLGLSDYFISPAINWGQKSRNLQAIADELNINIDTFAVIDDSPFERQEIGTAWSQVRVFADTEIGSLLDRPEFDVPVTEESKERRLSYLAEGKRKEIAQEYGEDYDAFLRSCQMRAHLFRPDTQANVERCLELIQRSNQLNLSTRRYEMAEFQALLQDSSILPVALAVTDAFGDYGTVGFATVELGGEVPLLRDLVISCRIAKKKIEHAWFQWIAEYLQARGADRLHGMYKPTSRNGVLLDTLLEMGFVDRGEVDGQRLVELSFTTPIAGADLVTVTSAGLLAPVCDPVPAE